MNDILEKPRLRKQDIEFIVERIEAYDDHIDIRLRSNIDALLHVSGSDAIEQAACETVEPVRKVRNQRKDEREIHTVSNGDPQLTVLERESDTQMLLALLAGVIEQRRKYT